MILYGCVVRALIVNLWVPLSPYHSRFKLFFYRTAGEPLPIFLYILKKEYGTKYIEKEYGTKCTEYKALRALDVRLHKKNLHQRNIWKSSLQWFGIETIFMCYARKTRCWCVTLNEVSLGSCLSKTTGVARLYIYLIIVLITTSLRLIYMIIVMLAMEKLQVLQYVS